AIILASSARDFVFGRSKDGVGGVYAAWADDTARFLNFGHFLYDCSYPDEFAGPTIALSGGRFTRVAICWWDIPSHSEYFSRPSTNLNFKLNDPSGVAVPSQGVSNDNAWELIEFDAPVTGNYQIFITRGHCNNPVGRVGYAWWQNF
ncbi:MAG TPA: hypothetical protein VFV34_09945, partial [Blastocatellia bacterium]|nr:hypothetical protein [Blastocatellia bacterium]